MSGIRLHTVAASYAIWLFAVLGAFYLGHGKDVTSLQFAVLGGAIPAGCQILLFGVETRGLVAPVKLWLAYLLVILLSYVVNGMNPQTAPTGDGSVIPAAWTPLVYTVNAAFIMGIGTLVAGCPDRRLLRSIASIYCILGGLFLVYVDVTGERTWGRLTANDITPNVWGLMGLAVCLAALARKFGPIAIASFAAGFATILVASSREHLLALAIVLLVIAAMNFREMTRPRLFALLAISCLTLFAASALLDPYILNAIHYVNTDVLLLYSPNRGLGSGFTGRTGVWSEAFDLWFKSPLFGFGYRQHERFLAGAPAHSAYLAVLADTGLLGFIIYIVLLIRSLIASWGIEDKRTCRLVVTVVVSYIIIGFFDRRTIDAGNPMSLLFLMCCSLALADQSLRKRAEWLRQASAQRDETIPTDHPLPAQ